MISRSCGSCCISWMKPRPSSTPIRFSVGTLHVVEEQFGGVLCLLAQLVEDAAAAEAFDLVGLDDDQRNALGAFGRIGLGDDDDEIGRAAIGDEGLRAVDDIVVAVAPGRGLDRLKVGAGARLGHGDGADQFAGGQPRQPALLLLLGAVMQDVGRDDAVVQRDAEAIDALLAERSMITASWAKLPPAPPYSSGMEAQSSPASPALFHNSRSTPCWAM